MQLNPALIDKIEVMTNPGVKYDADVDAVLNILLKKNMRYGISGRLNTEIPTSKYFFSYTNGGLDYFVKNLRLYVSGNLGIENWELDILRERTSTAESNSVDLSQYGRGSDKEAYRGFSYGADWFINDNNILNLSSNLQPPVSERINLNSEMSYLTDLQTSNTKTKSLADFENSYTDYSLFYKHKFQKKDHEITFESNYSSNKNYRDEDYYEQVYDQNHIITNDTINQRYQIKDNGRRQNMAKSDYTYPITDKIKFALGCQGDIIQINNAYTEKVSAFYDQLNYRENRLSAYSNLSWSIGKIYLQSGVRFEMSNIKIEHSETTTSNYNCLLPFLSGQYKLGEKQTFRLNYRRSIQRPGINQLSPFNYKDDSYAISIGNPRLNPAFSDKFEFTHRIQILGPMFIGYKPYINFVSDGIQQLSSGSDTIKKYYENVSNEFEYGLNINGTVNPMKWFEISPSFTYYERALQALPKYNIPEQYRSSWRFSVSSKISLPKDWSLFVNFNYNAPVISHQSTYVRSYNLGTGFNKMFNKNFNIQVLVFNPGSTQFIFNKTTIHTESLKLNSVSSVNFSYIFNIRLKYSFSVGKEGKKVETHNDSDADSNRGGIM